MVPVQFYFFEPASDLCSIFVVSLTCAEPTLFSFTTYIFISFCKSEKAVAHIAI